MAAPEPLPSPGARSFPCVACGANLEFTPGTARLGCRYCGSENEVPRLPDASVEELDFARTLRRLAEPEQVEALAVTCEGCGATTTLGVNVTADRCAFCDAPLVDQRRTLRQLRPQALLPFALEKKDARARFLEWLSGRWFAPGDLARRASADGLDGVYIPFWTYDCETSTAYAGQRGDWYFETETYSAVEDGRTVTRTRQVRRTRWRARSGRVAVSFDDLLVLASESLPRAITERLEPWDLGALVPYDDAYLAGFRAECYRIGLEEGFERARALMAPAIDSAIRGDIGGDEQRILDAQTRYAEVTFKHVLLPVWLSAYRYRDRVYRFVINARTGEVQGERPYSIPKILLFSVLVVAALLAAVYLGGGFDPPRR
jgi:hypothetical protein